MPIKPENKELYPPDWPYVRKRILERDKHCCCGCGLHDHSVGYRDDHGNFIPCGGNLVMDDYGRGFNPNTGLPLSFKEASNMAEFQSMNDEMGNKYIVIVLTVAHLDHHPENCADDNLDSLCQRCHNIYDRPHRNETMHLTRKRGQLELQFT
jgi:5-methylcytosine-specific restriction endonuclease McrA